MAAPPAGVLPQAEAVFKKNRSCFVLFRGEALFLSSHRGGESDSDQQSFRSNKTADSLAPWFLFILDEHAMPLRFQLPSRLFDVINIKFEPGLRRRNVVGP